MTHDTDYFRRRAAEARAAARSKGESVEVAGDLALAYAALAKRRASAAAVKNEADEATAIPLEARSRHLAADQIQPRLLKYR